MTDDTVADDATEEQRLAQSELLSGPWLPATSRTHRRSPLLQGCPGSLPAPTLAPERRSRALNESVDPQMQEKRAETRVIGWECSENPGGEAFQTKGGRLVDEAKREEHFYDDEVHEKAMMFPPRAPETRGSCRSSPILSMGCPGWSQTGHLQPAERRGTRRAACRAPWRRGWRQRRAGCLRRASRTRSRQLWRRTENTATDPLHSPGR